MENENHSDFDFLETKVKSGYCKMDAPCRNSSKEWSIRIDDRRGMKTLSLPFISELPLRLPVGPQQAWKMAKAQCVRSVEAMEAGLHHVTETLS